MTSAEDATASGGKLRIALAALFWLPLLSGIVSRLRKGSTGWFSDYGAIACAAEKYLQGEPIYTRGLSCEGLPSSFFIYHPWVAQIFAWPLAHVGRDGLMLSYVAIYVLSIALMIWFMIGRGGAAPRRKRAWFASFITGSSIYWGNIGLILNALISGAAIMFRRWPIVLVLAVAIAGFIKPVFLVFAIVFAVMRKPLMVRIFYALAAVALGVAPSAWVLLIGDPLAQQWTALVEEVVYIDAPGYAYFGWLAAVGAPLGSLGVTLGYFAYAALLSLAGLVITESLDLDDEQRMLFGLALGVLLLPRLMSQDFWLLGPGLVTLAIVTAAHAPVAGKWIERALLACCIIALIGSLADLGDESARLATLGLALTVGAAAPIAASSARVSVGALWRRLWTGAAD